MNKFVLGVDGGNTKTDYLLFDLKGNFIDGIRKGTISHEALKGSFLEAKELLNNHIEELLLRNKIRQNQIISSCFGLAGIDTKSQKNNMEKVIQELNFKNFVLCNDGFIPIKIGATNKYGVAVINGTGTVICGIDQTNYCQVGGFGIISADDAGGSYFVRQVVREVYCNLYRNGENTTLKDYLFDVLSITEEQKDDFMDLVIENVIQNRSKHKEIIQKLFYEVENNDHCAKKIVKKSAIEIANGIVGCLKELHLDNIEIIFAGSVFVNCNSKYYFNEIKKEIKKHIKQKFKIILVEEVPAVGSVLWALELAEIEPLKLKNKIKREIKKYQY